MSELMMRGGVMIWPLLLLSVLALALMAYDGCLLLTLRRQARRGAADATGAGRGDPWPMGLDRLRRGIEHLFLIASIAPVCGLLGTVLGIIRSFAALSLARPDARILSLGLSEALLTTAAGLIIALPCQVAGHFLQQGLDRLPPGQGKGRGPSGELSGEFSGEPYGRGES